VLPLHFPCGKTPNTHVCCADNLHIQIASPPVALAARARAPEPEQKSFGAQRTEKLIQDAGTPEAVRPGARNSPSEGGPCARHITSS